MRLVAGLMAGAALFASASATAQIIDSCTPKMAREGRCLTFGGTPITGTLDGPGGGYVGVIRKPKFKSLIEVRTSFQPELEKTLAKL